MEALTESFSRHFEVVTAVSEEQQRLALHLRYQVYCIETGFEDSRAHPEGLEQDEFDTRSIHSLLIHRDSGLVAGTVRLVLPNRQTLQAPFPIERHCGDVLTQVASWPIRSCVAEISRFCISKEFKRRMAEAHTLWGIDTEMEGIQHAEAVRRRLMPHITVGLFAAIVRMSAKQGIRYWYAVMEPALLRLLRRFAVRFTPIGPLVDYHGQRQPCFACADQVLQQMHDESFPVWELITGGGSLWPHAEECLPPLVPPFMPAAGLDWPAFPTTIPLGV